MGSCAALSRKLDAALQQACGRELPLDAVPIRFASWMGGDREGNPNVSASVTRGVLEEQMKRARSLLMQDLEYLRLDLSVTESTAAFRDLLPPELHTSREPYK